MSILLPLKWISEDEVVAIHTRVIEETGGKEGVLHPDIISNIVDAPFATFGGEELYPTLWHKVAQLIREINSHGFTDGNKRTALVAADVILRRNGYCIIESSALEYFFLELADTGKTIEEIVTFLQQHSRRHYG